MATGKQEIVLDRTSFNGLAKVGKAAMQQGHVTLGDYLDNIQQQQSSMKVDGQKSVEKQKKQSPWSEIKKRFSPQKTNLRGGHELTDRSQGQTVDRNDSGFFRRRGF